jgi:hypothetical protein
MNEDGVNPSEDPSEAVNEFMKMFGGEKEAEAFMAEAELAAQEVAWAGIYQMYKGLQIGGFSREEALELIVIYMIKVVTGGLG